MTLLLYIAAFYADLAAETAHSAGDATCVNTSALLGEWKGAFSFVPGYPAPLALRFERNEGELAGAVDFSADGEFETVKSIECENDVFSVYLNTKPPTHLEFIVDSQKIEGAFVNPEGRRGGLEMDRIGEQ